MFSYQVVPMCFLSRGPVSRTSISQRMRGVSTVNVESSSLWTTVPGAVYSAELIRTVASRMFSTGALDSFFLPFLVMSLPTVIDVVSSLCLRVARMAPWCRPGEIGVRLVDCLCHRTDHNGGSEILLVIICLPITLTSVQVGVFVPAGGPCVEVWNPRTAPIRLPVAAARQQQ